MRYRLRDKQGNKGQVSETVENRYRDAVKRLEAIQSGKLDLVRDRSNGSDLPKTELPDANVDIAQISGSGLQADNILEGY